MSSLALTPAYKGQLLQTQSTLPNRYLLGSYRFYIPQLASFTAPDTLSPFAIGGTNRYSYSNLDPINNSDPSGHMMRNVGRLAGNTPTLPSASSSSRPLKREIFRGKMRSDRTYGAVVAPLGEGRYMPFPEFVQYVGARHSLGNDIMLKIPGAGDTWSVHIEGKTIQTTLADYLQCNLDGDASITAWALPEANTSLLFPIKDSNGENAFDYRKDNARLNALYTGKRVGFNTFEYDEYYLPARSNATLANNRKIIEISTARHFKLLDDSMAARHELLLRQGAFQRPEIVAGYHQMLTIFNTAYGIDIYNLPPY